MPIFDPKVTNEETIIVGFFNCSWTPPPRGDPRLVHFFNFFFFNQTRKKKFKKPIWVLGDNDALSKRRFDFVFSDLGYFDRNEMSKINAKYFPGLELQLTSEHLQEYDYDSTISACFNNYVRCKLVILTFIFHIHIKRFD